MTSFTPIGNVATPGCNASYPEFINDCINCKATYNVKDHYCSTSIDSSTLLSCLHMLQHDVNYSCSNGTSPKMSNSSRRDGFSSKLTTFLFFALLFSCICSTIPQSYAWEITFYEGGYKDNECADGTIIVEQEQGVEALRCTTSQNIGADTFLPADAVQLTAESGDDASKGLLNVYDSKDCTGNFIAQVGTDQCYANNGKVYSVSYTLKHSSSRIIVKRAKSVSGDRIEKRNVRCLGFKIDSQEDQQTPHRTYGDGINCPGDVDSCTEDKTDLVSQTFTTTYSVTNSAEIDGIGISQTFGESYAETASTSTSYSFTLKPGQSGHIASFADVTVFHGSATQCEDGTDRAGDYTVVKANGAYWTFDTDNNGRRSLNTRERKCGDHTSNCCIIKYLSNVVATNSCIDDCNNHHSGARDCDNPDNNYDCETKGILQSDVDSLLECYTNSCDVLKHADPACE